MMTHAGRVPIAARLFAAVGLTVTIVGAIGAITLRAVDPAPVVQDTFGFGDVALVGFVVMGVAFSSVGALLVVRRPRNAVGWCMVITGLGHAVGVLAAAATFSLVATGTDSALGAAQYTAWLTGLLVTVGGEVLAGIALIFPTGRGHTRRWDIFARFCLIGAPISVLMIALQPGPVHVFPTIENPLGLAPDLRPVVGVQFSALAIAWTPFLPPILIWSLVSRHRLADATERQQLKWFALAIATASVGMALSAVGAVVFRNPPEAGLAIFGFAGAFVPVAIGIAILRHHLYDIDRIISRTIAYGVVSAVTAVVFGGVIVLLSAVLASFAQGETIAVAGSTLAAFAVFQPVLRRVRRSVDRRFNRARYDAEQTVAAFSARLRDEVDIATVTTDLHATVQDAVKPASLRLWIRAAKP